MIRILDWNKIKPEEILNRDIRAEGGRQRRRGRGDRRRGSAATRRCWSTRSGSTA